MLIAAIRSGQLLVSPAAPEKVFTVEEYVEAGASSGG
jgi:hypothetical protein